MLLTLIVFLIILSVLVLIHELGHFFVAKKLGIKVEEFGFGLPPRLFGKKIGETIYSINWLPIGGFVKLYGEDEAGAGRPQLKVQSEKLKVKDKERAFFARTPWQRASVVVAGVVMNTVLAIAIFYVFLFISGFKTELPLLTHHKFFFVQQIDYNIDSTDSVVSAVVRNSPIEKIGLLPPVKMLSVNGQPIQNRNFFIDTVNKNKGKEITLTWQDLKTGKIYSATVVPRVSPPKNEGALGIGFFPLAFLDYRSPSQKVLSGIVHPVNLLVYNFDVLAKLFSVSVEKKTAAPLSEGVSGPVGIGSIVGNCLELPTTKEKSMCLLNLSGILSISLAFFNILPIPALDGGRLFFILIEAVTRKKINPKIEGYAHSIGMAILLGLILLITFKDIGKLFVK